MQLPSSYLIATVEELDSQLWTVNSIKPNTDNTVSLTVAETATPSTNKNSPRPTRPGHRAGFMESIWLRNLPICLSKANPCST